jgi:hypothetical protein
MRNKTPTALLLLGLLALCGVLAPANIPFPTLTGCATTRPGADPVLLRAEQTLEVSFATIDGLLYLEKYNQAALTAVAPDAHKVAEMLRTEAPVALKAATAAIDVYRANRTPQAQADLATWLAVVQELAHQAQVILAAYGGAK